MAATPKNPEINLEGNNWHVVYGAICDNYRLARFNAKYCGRRLQRARRANLALEIFTAIAAVVTAAYASGKFFPVNQTLMTGLTICVAMLAAIKPLINLNNAVVRYARQHENYRDIDLSYRQLIESARAEGRVTLAMWRKHQILNEQYRQTEKKSDPNPSDRVRKKLQAEVDKEIPLKNLEIG